MLPSNMTNLGNLTWEGVFYRLPLLKPSPVALSTPAATAKLTVLEHSLLADLGPLPYAATA